MNAEDLYVRLIGDPGRLRELRRLRYWCDRSDRRCLLLDAVGVLDTILMHQKRFKQSDEINERRSSAAGRTKNTFDGQGHWKPRTYFVDTSALALDDPVARLAIQCDHVGVLPDGNEVTLSPDSFWADWNAGHTEVRVRADGTRFVVQ